METELERIAEKARCEPQLRFTSLAHQITRDRVQRSLARISNNSAAGVDGQTVEAAKESFDEWIEPMLQSIHRRGYRAPAVRRVYIPKPGKTEKRPLGVPTVSDRALQRSTAEVLSAIYEQDFLPCSFGGRPRLSAHHALSTLNEAIAGGLTGWVLEADLKNFLDASSHYTPGFFERAEEVRSGRRYLNSYAFCPSAVDVNGLELTALYTLQDGLPRDAE
jgi:RNA-directed DNA polymerase